MIDYSHIWVVNGRVLLKKPNTTHYIQISSKKALANAKVPLFYLYVASLTLEQLIDSRNSYLHHSDSSAEKYNTYHYWSKWLYQMSKWNV